VSSSTTEASISGHLHINLSFLETGYFHSCRSQGVLTAQPYSSSHQDAMIDAEQSVLGGTFHPRRGHFALRVECPGRHSTRGDTVLSDNGSTAASTDGVDYSSQLLV